MPLPLRQAVHGLLEGDALQPALVGVFGVLHLIHHADGVAPVGVHRLIEGYRIHNGVQGKHHVLPLQLQLFGDLLDAGLPLVLGQELLLGLEHLVGRVPHGAGHPHG